MSQDLLAAFGTTTLAPDRSEFNLTTTRPTPHLSAADRSANTLIAQDDDNDDDFGDFEDASVSDSGPTGNLSKQSVQPAVQRKIEANHTLPKQRTASSSKGTRPVVAPSPQVVEPDSRVGRHPFTGHMDVLFDQDDEEYDAGVDELYDLAMNPEAAMAYSKKLIAEQQANHLEAERSSPATGFSKDIAPSKRGTQSKADVLFDFDEPHSSTENDQDDSWGDFEGGAQTVDEFPPAASKSQGPDLDMAALKSRTQIQSRPSGKPWSARKSDRLTREQVTQTLAHMVEGEDVWDDFDTVSAPSIHTPSIKETSKVSRPSPQARQNDRLPPSNIPPPTLLLSSFPPLFSRADDDLFRTLGKLPPQQKQVLLGHAATQQYLRSFLGHCIALAYVVAGRKLRWRRDLRLSQSMRIGPAAAGGKGGMKLVGIDKSEVAKEDREVFDVVSLYRMRMGKLQSACSGTSSGSDSRANSKLPPVPNINEKMAIKTLKPLEGGLTAPHACAICGLKREERVVQVDHDIEDSFDEWWIEGMDVHVVCRDFWEQEGVKMRGR